MARHCILPIAHEATHMFIDGEDNSHRCNRIQRCGACIAEGESIPMPAIDDDGLCEYHHVITDECPLCDGTGDSNYYGQPCSLCRGTGTYLDGEKEAANG